MRSTFQNWHELYSDGDADVLKFGGQLISLYFGRENPHQAHQICCEEVERKVVSLIADMRFL
jgi:hypothetical protein